MLRGDNRKRQQVVVKRQQAVGAFIAGADALYSSEDDVADRTQSKNNQQPAQNVSPIDAA